jgi:hypothetical protein
MSGVISIGLTRELPSDLDLELPRVSVVADAGDQVTLSVRVENVAAFADWLEELARAFRQSKLELEEYEAAKHGKK